MKRLKKGDKIKIVVPFEGFGEYGIRKGSVGYVVKQSIYRGMKTYQVDFPNARKELMRFPHEIKKSK